MARLVRDGVVLSYEESGRGAPPIVFVHGVACNRSFWPAQIEHFSRQHRVMAVDLRGHGGSDAPNQRYTMDVFAADITWMCEQLEINQPVVVGHSLGGLVALKLAATYPDQIRAAAMIDSVLLAPGDRTGVVNALVATLRGPHADQVLRDYFTEFFAAADDAGRSAWILDQAARTRPHVTSSVWEESLLTWDDADALDRCHVPLLYLDAGTGNADLERAIARRPEMVIGRTIGSGHFSPLEVPEQINAMIGRFLALAGRMETRIRPSETEQDLAAFRDLNEEWIARLFVLEDEDRRQLEDPRRAYLEPGGEILIAELEGRAVGCVAIVPDGTGAWELSKMAVSPELRGRGTGRRLLSATIQRARELGARSLFLGSSTRLPNAVHLYEAYGFKHVPAETLDMPYDRADVFMQLVLEHPKP